MNKAFLFVIMLVSVSFVGCIEDSDDDLLTEDNTVDESSNEDTNQEDETITPVGTNGTVNMAPYVTAGAWLDEEWIIFDPLTDDEARLGIYVNWAAKDFDGSIANAGFDLDLDMNIDVFVEEDFGILISNTSAQNETLEIQNSNWKYDFVTNRDVCGLIFHTTFAFIAVDNEGATGIQLVQYVFQDRIEYDDMMEIKDNFPGLLGITDDMEDLYDDPNCEGGPNSNPIATFFVSEDSAHVYHVEVIKVSRQAPLEDFSFFLKDGSGSTYVGGNGFGEIAMQFQGGEEMGIDMTYSGDDEALESRATNVTNDNGSQFPVHFSDNDRDGMLSSGDQFLVYGTNSGPAEDGWKLDIVYDLTGDIIGSARMM
jgi:hypothetical protein